MSLLALVQPPTPWRGRPCTCRGCGTTRLPELIDGHCAECFADIYGPLGLDDVPPGETIMATMTEDLPKLFQNDRRLCSVCGEAKDEEGFAETQWVKDEEGFAETQWVKAQWRTCLACQSEDAALAPALAVVPALAEPFVPRAWAKHYDRCVQCGRDDREAGPRGLCLTGCYPAAQKAGYTGNIGPKTLKVYTDAENRALVDAYLATINRPTGALATPAPTTEATPLISDAVSGVTPLIAPPTTTATPVLAASVTKLTAGRTVADELRALLDGLARERAALEEERHRVNARLEELRCQVGAVETTIALVAR